MSDEMAVIDKAASEEAILATEESPPEAEEVPENVPNEQPSEAPKQEADVVAAIPEVAPMPIKKEPAAEQLETPEEYLAKMETDQPNDSEIKLEPETEGSSEKEVKDILEDNAEDKRGVKRRASIAFSDFGVDDDGDMKPLMGFEQVEPVKTEWYLKILERLEEEVQTATKNFVPLRQVMGIPGVPARASKRPRTDTDGSRPSSAMSSRSDDAGTDASAASSPANRRRATTEMSSPLLRAPLERGWKRELVFRAALDSHSRRNADIYYYTPQGKKLRSTREVAEHLSGSGFTLENFSFFKEPLGVDDPEKEIIRDAKLMRRVESPVSTPAPVAPVEGKRTPKPKAPKGASPEPTLKSPPAKIKVKSVGSRLSGSGPLPAQPAKKNEQKKPAAAVSNADNNNTAAWKKPRPPGQTLHAGQPLHTGQTQHAGQSVQSVAAQPPQPPPPLQSRPPPLQSSPENQPPRQTVRPCSMSCGRGTVPSLACAACLCLYHPVCAGFTFKQPPAPFYCKNCRKSSSPPLEPPPLVHKSGVSAAGAGVAAPVPRRVPAVAPGPVAAPAPVPVPAKVPKQTDKRVLLRMKVAGSGAEGERVWSVTGPPRGAPSLPQSIVALNGRRFIVVPRAMAQPAQAQQHSITTTDCE